MTSWFRFISDPMGHALVFLATSIGSAGVAIIIFTLAVKLLLVPLTLQQLRSAKSMQVLQPKIKELQAKHKGDKQKITEETMALYKEHKVNPAAGCLPLLLQMPVIYGLYGALLDLGNPKDALFNPLFAQHFMWLTGQQITGNGTLTGLAAPDPLHILPILCVITQWVQQRMMLTKNQAMDPQQQSMQSIMQFMPLMIGFFAWNYASGLALYWVVSTLFSIVLQYFITGWGSLFDRPTMGGFGGLLAGPSTPQTGSTPAKNGSSSNGQNTGRPKVPAGAAGGGGNRGRRRRAG
jgi:YidC/Oxa1 family membrane protein insertase